MLKNPSYSIHPIGHVNASNDEFSLQIHDDYRKGLSLVDQFSHIHVFWWATGQDNQQSRTTLETELFYAPGTTAGVFACRSPFRPNPIAVTLTACLGVDMDRGIIRVPYMDALDQSPIIDIKPYFPVADRVKNATVAPWAREWPQWYEDAHQMEQIFARFMEPPAAV
jgi:tRNA-Thr(GGU) m(6)t(6)A37 methyltransferase TsaA